MKNNLFINIKGQLVPLDKPMVMGIVNLTPDSFFEGSRYNFAGSENADIVDLGACSTRPGGDQCNEEEEIKRFRDAKDEIKQRFLGKILSIDTYRAEVARYTIEEFDADIINDISGGDEAIFDVVAAYNKAYILTYPEGGGVDEMIYYFSKKIDTLARKGVADIILDPGFGFGKTMERNFEILRDLEALHTMGFPILVGISRKRMIHQTLGITPKEALNGTTVLNTILLGKGAHILRVHDVKEALEAVKLYNLSK